ncbi:MAG: L,D-transpeptidase family protein [Candidatus Marinimicrobia bacterium]|nr:L,D-transpeptidase family protein [Candidatus Neomarinimicrobiota bacterium]
MISNIINISADSTGYIFVVDKTHQKMLMVKSDAPGDLKIVNKYKITTGRRSGDKERRGDLKTPEGIYYIDGRVPNSKLTPKFGPIAFTLDYPNFVDRLQKRNGSNIWIHGRDEAIKDFITEGCISMENDQILGLRKYIDIGQTPVIILDNLSDYSVDQAGYKSAINRWLEFTNGWAQSWDGGDISTYCSYYDLQYVDGNGRNLAKFKEYKSGLEKTYKWKTVIIDRVCVLISDKETHLKFRQRYISPTFYSEGEKLLTLVPSRSQWKIIQETFETSSPRISPTEMIEQFLKNWESAWEKQDIEDYLAFYAPDFVSGGYDLNGWCKYKSDLFQSVKKVSVERSALSVQSTEKQIWHVTFRQVYQADGYRDVGVKTMTIRGIPGDLKISKEEWRENN